MFRIKPKDDAKKDDKKTTAAKPDAPAKDAKGAPSDKSKPESKPENKAEAPSGPKVPAEPKAAPVADMPMGEPDADDMGGSAAPAAMPMPDAGLPPDLGAPASPASPVHLYGKLSQFTAGYLGPENGPFMCGNCRHFDGQASCEVVNGMIDPNGCCSNFEATDTPAGMQAPPLDNALPPDLGAPADVGQTAGITPPVDLQG